MKLNEPKSGHITRVVRTRLCTLDLLKCVHTKLNGALSRFARNRGRFNEGFRLLSQMSVCVFFGAKNLRQRVDLLCQPALASSLQMFVERATKRLVTYT